MQEEIIRIDSDGSFRRKQSEFRDSVTADGTSGFKAEDGRYHLYVAWACPWAHRTLFARKALGLEHAIDVSVVHWLMDESGAWNFAPAEGYTEPLYGARSLQELYHRAEPAFHGIGTVPVLWDTERETIVNNESREIVRMFSTGFRRLQANEVTLLPDGRVAEIDEMITTNYAAVNDGVYKAGFARNQQAYDAAVARLFERLDELEGLLSHQRYLLGSELTEADVCLWPTLLRFDLVYHYHFKCNLRALVDYPNLWAYTRDIYQLPGVRDTVRIDDIKRHYFASHGSINPTRIVPIGPTRDFDEPHDRDERFS